MPDKATAFIENCTSCWNRMKSTKTNVAAKAAKTTPRKSVELQCQMVFNEPDSSGLNALLTTKHDPEHHRGTKLFLARVDHTSRWTFTRNEFGPLALREVSLVDALKWYVLSNSTATSSTGNPDILCALAASALTRWRVCR